jgi:hypothetical protein
MPHGYDFFAVNIEGKIRKYDAVVKAALHALVIMLLVARQKLFAYSGEVDR